MAYNSGIPSAVLFAGPQKHTAITSSGGICLNMDTDQSCEERNFGGREVKKQTAVRAMYSPMLNKTTNITLWTDRAWRAPVAKQEEKVVLVGKVKICSIHSSLCDEDRVDYLPDQQQHTCASQLG